MPTTTGTGCWEEHETWRVEAHLQGAAATGLIALWECRLGCQVTAREHLHHSSELMCHPTKQGGATRMFWESYTHKPTVVR